MAPGGGHRAPARAPRDRTVAGVWRLVGLDARAGVRGKPSTTCYRAGVARYLPGTQVGDRLVLPEPGWGRRDLPGPVGRVRFHDPAGRALRNGARVLQTPHERRPEGVGAGLKDLVHLGGGHEFPASEPRLRSEV